MLTENNFSFIKERINEIRSAIIYSMSDELIKIPASIIRILKIDEEGQLWFFINRPSQLFHDSEKKFPARMQFYRKGKPFYLNVAGCAVIEESNNLINEFSDNMEKEASALAMQNMMLVKLKISSVEYHEQKQVAPGRNFIQILLQNLYDSLFRSSYHYRPLAITTEPA